MGLECAAPGGGRVLRVVCLSLSFSSHIPHFHEIRLEGECNEGAITYFE